MTTHPLAILNSTIVTTDGNYQLISLSLSEAEEIIRDYQSTSGLVSYVGHLATVQAINDLFGIEIGLSRDLFAQEVGQNALCVKLRQRSTPGVDLTLEELITLGFSVTLLSRTA